VAAHRLRELAFKMLAVCCQSLPEENNPFETEKNSIEKNGFLASRSKTVEDYQTQGQKL
jgi:hypothetical protein